MIEQLPPARETLIAALDPKRDYGERTYDDVLTGIRAGAILIEPGQSLPVLVEARMHRAIKGSGQPPQDGVSVQQQIIRKFRELAIDDAPEAYALTIKGMRDGDPRWGKIWWELAGGKMGEAKGGEAIAAAFLAFLAAQQAPERRTVTVTDVIDG